MKSLKIALAAVAVSASSLTFAAETASNPFAECGIGAGIFPNNDTAAIISNIVWDLGTTALTSGTASPDACAGLDKDVATFMHDTYNQVEENVAMGSGEHLATLMNLANCGSAEAPAMISAFQANFGEALSVPAYAEQSQQAKAAEMYKAFSAASAQTGACVI